MSDRPACYPEPSTALIAGVGEHGLPLLDTLTSPVPCGVCDSQMRLFEEEKFLTDIAREAGFAHANPVARCMRRVLGLSPSPIVEPLQ